MSASTSAKDVEAESFARKLAEELRIGLARNRYDDLVLMAPPAFLGMVRGLLDAVVERRVIQSAAKDYTRERTPEVAELARSLLSDETAPA